MEFDLFSRRGGRGSRGDGEWSSDVLTSEDYSFDGEFVGCPMGMLPSKSALYFFHIIFTENVYELIVKETNLYAAQQRIKNGSQKAVFELSTGDVLFDAKRTPAGCIK